MNTSSKIIKQDHLDQDVSLESRLDLSDFAETGLGVEQKVIKEQDLLDHDVARGIIVKARQEAEHIREKARNIFLQVEAKMSEAKAQGFEKGHQEGLASVTKELIGIQKQQEKLFARVEKEALLLVYAIGQKMVGDAIKTSEEALLGMIRQALQSSLGSQLTVYLHPDDYERLRAHETHLVQSMQSTQTLQIKPTENVRESGCVIESELGTIEAQLDYQLVAIKKALGLEDDDVQGNGFASA